MMFYAQPILGMACKGTQLVWFVCRDALSGAAGSAAASFERSVDSGRCFWSGGKRRQMGQLRCRSDSAENSTFTRIRSSRFRCECKE